MNHWNYLVKILSFGKDPYGGSSNEEIKKRILAGQTLEKPSGDYPTELYKLMKMCWKREGSKRPTFQQIHERLQPLTGNSAAPPKQKSEPVNSQYIRL